MPFNRPKLSETATGKRWISQFPSADQGTAAEMLDAMLLLNAEEVSSAIRVALNELAGRGGRGKRRVALFAERKLSKGSLFTEQMLPDAAGRKRLRAVGRNFSPIKPIRGGTRVGSEGLIASVISQEVMAWPKVLINHPGPDRMRAKSGPTQTLVIVTDLIGSGQRITTWLDKLWNTATVRSWVSGGRLDFKIVAVASTKRGAEAVRAHRLRPEVLTYYRAPTVNTAPLAKSSAWLKLIANNGPLTGRGAGALGYGNDPCLVAFSYRLANNTPAIIHETDPTVPWQALYDGPIPTELSRAFGERSIEEISADALVNAGVTVSADLTAEETLTVLVLSLLRGHLRPSSAETIAGQTLVPVLTVERILQEGKRRGFFTAKGRLTDVAQATLLAGRVSDRRRPEIPTNQMPYYPRALRGSGAI